MLHLQIKSEKFCSKPVRTTNYHGAADPRRTTLHPQQVSVARVAHLDRAMQLIVAFYSCSWHAHTPQFPHLRVYLAST